MFFLCKIYTFIEEIEQRDQREHKRKYDTTVPSTQVQMQLSASTALQSSLTSHYQRFHGSGDFAATTKP